MIEVEKTFLIKTLPDLSNCKSKEIIDIYFPKTDAHPCLRVRKNGDSYEITKKKPVNDGDASHQIEQTIDLTKEEFEILSKLDGKRIHKIRYYYPYESLVAEIDVFKSDLEGLVLVDFEFDSVEEKDAFGTPEFCLADVTQELFVAGGMICGKKYSDIENDLKRFNYQKVYV